MSGEDVRRGGLICGRTGDKKEISGKKTRGLTIGWGRLRK